MRRELRRFIPFPSSCARPARVVESGQSQGRTGSLLSPSCEGLPMKVLFGRCVNARQRIDYREMTDCPCHRRTAVVSDERGRPPPSRWYQLGRLIGRLLTFSSRFAARRCILVDIRETRWNATFQRRTRTGQVRRAGTPPPGQSFEFHHGHWQTRTHHDSESSVPDARRSTLALISGLSACVAGLQLHSYFSRHAVFVFPLVDRSGPVAPPPFRHSTR